MQVDLILMGERYREMLQQGIDPARQAQMDRNASGSTENVSTLHNALHLAPQLCFSDGFSQTGFLQGLCEGAELTWCLLRQGSKKLPAQVGGGAVDEPD